MRHLVSDLWRRVHSWWRRDRVRASPREGRLLGLAPPCLLLVAGQPAEVVRRTATRLPSGGVVRYDCLTRAGPALLEVRLSAAHAACQVTWRQGRRARGLAEDEVEVFPQSRAGR
jgi:hypothetical protein